MKAKPKEEVKVRLGVGARRDKFAILNVPLRASSDLRLIMNYKYGEAYVN